MESMYKPFRIVIIHKFGDTFNGIINRANMCDRKDLLLYGSIKPFNAPIALRFPNERFRHLKSKESHLIHEVFRVVLSSVVTSEPERQMITDIFA